MSKNYAWCELRKFIRFMCEQVADRHVRSVVDELAAIRRAEGHLGLNRRLDELLQNHYLSEHETDEKSNRVRIDFSNALLETVSEYDFGAHLNLLLTRYGFFPDNSVQTEGWRQEIADGQGRWQKPGKEKRRKR